MVSWKRIHSWMVKALEEPFFRAEMHRVEISLLKNKGSQLYLIEGGGNRGNGKVVVEVEQVEGFAART